MNEDITEGNIDALRKRWETDDHWELRKEFILQHKDSFELNRLLCLSQLFLNVETMQAVYSPDLMLLIERLGSQVDAVRVFREKRKSLDQMESLKRPKKSSELRHSFNQNPYKNYNRRTF